MIPNIHSEFQMLHILVNSFINLMNNGIMIKFTLAKLVLNFNLNMRILINHQINNRVGALL